MLYNYYSPEDQFWAMPPWAPDPEEETVEENDT
jgi:hypothetical protein